MFVLSAFGYFLVSACNGGYGNKQNIQYILCASHNIAYVHYSVTNSLAIELCVIQAWGQVHE